MLPPKSPHIPLESIFHADSEKHHNPYLKMKPIKVTGGGCSKNDVIADVSKNSKTTQTNSFLCTIFTQLDRTIECFCQKVQNMGQKKLTFNNFDKYDKRKICLSQIYKPYGLFYTATHFDGVKFFLSLSGVIRLA